MDLDRASTNYYDVLGYGFALRSEFPILTQRVAGLLRGFESSHAALHAASIARYDARRECSGAHSLALFRDGVLVQPATSEESLLDFLLWDVNANALRTTPFLAIHAAAASWNGHGLILPGKMNAGKTTLVAGLIKDGFDYLSDEAALIDPATGSLHPYAKPLWMEPPSVELLSIEDPTRHPLSPIRDHHIRAERLRPDCIGQVCEIRFVVAPQYIRGADTCLRRMTPGEMLMLLADNSFNVGRARGEGVHVLSRVLGATSCHHLTVGDLPSAVRAIRRLVTGKTKAQRQISASTCVSVA